MSVEVTIIRPTTSKVRDALGYPVPGKPSEETARVLVGPPSTDNMEAGRPNGATVALTLHFPKSYTASLRGCEVKLPDSSPWVGTYRVIGDPMPYESRLTPPPYNRPVEVERADG